MKVKNAQELAKLLNIDFDHLQSVWKVFVTQRDLSIINLYTELKKLLTEDEKIYLIHLGMDSISDTIMDALKDKKDA